jgi:hypothetical protein
MRVSYHANEREVAFGNKSSGDEISKPWLGSFQRRDKTSESYADKIALTLRESHSRCGRFGSVEGPGPDGDTLPEGRLKPDEASDVVAETI